MLVVDSKEADKTIQAIRNRRTAYVIGEVVTGKRCSFYAKDSGICIWWRYKPTSNH